ncbi:GbsR/MarR family transcriptional regulator [Saccharibacillus kuerlensis]|uniref:HTH-type transcriptional repressor GbsR n=1 Tax=Saccharibacillus kuerlensis TaxID=459527 RepID=A0ABQ2LCA4_9BACL|nr:winged helix DNA-binding protein [Saccharibacillus kuerlensis]GGO08199.1 HTH-type transcriptional repressor GbsR [Saccharibacillus kuerlensis]
MENESARETGSSVSPKRRELREKVIESIATTMDLYGVNHSFGQLYGIMYFEDRPMTLEEMKDYMNMSKSNMSYAVRALTESQMIYKLDEKKDRKDQYIAETDFFHTFRSFFGAKLQREVDVMLSSIREVTPDLSEIVLAQQTTPEEREQALRDLHKLQHAEQYYMWLQGFVDRLRDGDPFFGTEASQSGEKEKEAGR